MHFEDGFHLVVKRDCPTCTLIEPEIRKLVESGDFGQNLRIYIQDDPSYLSDLSQSVSDASLESSYRLKIETVPTLIRFEKGEETSRSVGGSVRNGANFSTIPCLESICPSQDRDVDLSPLCPESRKLWMPVLVTFPLIQEQLK